MRIPHDRVTVFRPRVPIKSDLRNSRMPSVFRVKTRQADHGDIRRPVFLVRNICAERKSRAFFDLGCSNWDLGLNEMRCRFFTISVLTALIVLLGSMLVACGRQVAEVPPAPEMRVVKDDLGREVRLPEKVTRAVSLAPSITEMVFAAGAGDRLVGVTSYCDFPAAAKNVQKVGDTQSPNIEAIIAVRPELILVSTASQLEAFASALEGQSAAVFVLDIRGLGDVADRLRRLGQVFGSGERAELAAIEFENRIAAVERHSMPERPVRVLLQISEADLFTIGRDSFITELIDRAGGISVTADIPGGYPKLSKETALALDPNVIILSDSPDNLKPNDALKNSAAVRRGRVYRINADILSRPGPRLADALEQLATLFRQEPAGN